jgi:hypothetical protein
MLAKGQCLISTKNGTTSLSILICEHRSDRDSEICGYVSFLNLPSTSYILPTVLTPPH